MCHIAAGGSCRLIRDDGNALGKRLRHPIGWRSMACFKCQDHRQTARDSQRPRTAERQALDLPGMDDDVKRPPWSQSTGEPVSFPSRPRSEIGCNLDASCERCRRLGSGERHLVSQHGAVANAVAPLVVRTEWPRCWRLLMTLRTTTAFAARRRQAIVRRHPPHAVKRADHEGREHRQDDEALAHEIDANWSPAPLATPPLRRD